MRVWLYGSYVRIYKQVYISISNVSEFSVCQRYCWYKKYTGTYYIWGINWYPCKQSTTTPVQQSITTAEKLDEQATLYYWYSLRSLHTYHYIVQQYTWYVRCQPESLIISQSDRCVKYDLPNKAFLGLVSLRYNLHPRLCTLCQDKHNRMTFTVLD